MQLGQIIGIYNTSLTLDWNFTYGGATVGASLVAPYESTVKCLTDQVAEFKHIRRFQAVLCPLDEPFARAPIGIMYLVIPLLFIVHTMAALFLSMFLSISCYLH
jgi:hypothetical protein